MASKRAATVSAWERDEHDGHYHAELHEHALRVDWHPGSAAERGSFSWSAERDERKHEPRERHEEMIGAMVAAETYAEKRAKLRAAS